MFKNKSEFKKEFTRRLIENYGCAIEQTHQTEKYMTLGNMVRDYFMMSLSTDSKILVSNMKVLPNWNWIRVLATEVSAVWLPASWIRQLL